MIGYFVLVGEEMDYKQCFSLCMQALPIRTVDAAAFSVWPHAVLGLARRRGGAGGVAVGEGRAAGALLLPAAALAGRRGPHAAGVKAVASAAQRRAAPSRLLTTLCKQDIAITDTVANSDDALWLQHDWRRDTQLHSVQ